MQHQSIDKVPESELPFLRREIQRFSQNKSLPYKPMVAVLHAIGREYGSSFSRKIAGIYANEDQDVPLTEQGFNGENALDEVRKVLDDDLGIDIPREEVSRCYTFLGLVKIADKHCNGKAGKADGKSTTI